MHKLRKPVEQLFPATSDGKLLMGTLIDFRDGRPIVVYPGSDKKGIVVRALYHIPEESREESIGSVALIALIEDEPVLLGVVGDYPSGMNREALDQTSQSVNRSVTIDGDRLVLEAKKEIILRCGGSEIIMRKDGKVVIKGKELSSRSSGTNKIKGSTVSIN